MRFNFDKENKSFSISKEIENGNVIPRTILGNASKEDHIQNWVFLQIFRPGTTQFSLPVIDKNALISQVYSNVWES